jgi:hypothetical protein
MAYPAQLPPAKIEPIVRPGASRWLKVAPADLNAFTSLNIALAAAVLLPSIVGLALLATPTPGPYIGGGVLGALVLTMIVAFVLTSQAGRRDVVSAPDYLFEGAPIDGAALDMLADIQQRFGWAEKQFGRVPTGITWSEVKDQVAVLLWEAAEHAAKVSALDAELHNLAYANDGTPQAALRTNVRQRRAALWSRLEDTQREADDLAREATNTAAAARIALTTGTLAQLELITPSGADLVARGTLAAARARLALLTEVWTELDETGALASERLRALDPPEA